MRILKNVFVIVPFLLGAFAHAADTASTAKNRFPAAAAADCEKTAISAAVKKASEAMDNCKASSEKPARLSSGPLQTIYMVMVNCPAFAGDQSEYAFHVKTKVAFGTGNGKPICFADSAEAVSAPPEALRK